MEQAEPSAGEFSASSSIFFPGLSFLLILPPIGLLCVRFLNLQLLLLFLNILLLLLAYFSHLLLLRFVVFSFTSLPSEQYVLSNLALISTSSLF